MKQEAAFPAIKGLPLALAIVIFSEPMLAQAGRWSPHPSNSPGQVRPLPRAHAVFDLNTTTGEYLLFGGYRGSLGVFNDTWSFDGQQWTLHNVPALTPRSSPSGCFDPSRGNFILFGGHVNGPQWTQVADTWAWTGSTWQSLSPMTSPSARGAARLVADPHRGRLVMFGGTVFGYPQTFREDTWEWDGFTWHAITTPNVPPGRGGYAMAYDPHRHRMVLFGGGTDSVTYGDTWEYDGTNWVQVTPSTSPPPRTWTRMVYSAPLGGVLLHGGLNGCTNLDDLWLYDGVNWHPLWSHPGGPSPRDDAALSPTATGGVLLFGGRTTVCPSFLFSDETWTLEPASSSYATYRTSCVSGTGALAVLNALDLPRVGQPLHLQVTGLSPFKVGMLLLGFQDQYWGANSLPLDLTAFGATGCFMNTEPFILYPVPSDASGVALPILLIPATPIAFGVEFFNQFASLDDAPPSRTFPITTTNAGRGIVGL